MAKVAIIGDIHGCYNTFVKLLDKLPDDIDQIYTVGDLIDRGSKSKEVVQECIDRGIISVRGNHEDMFLDYIRKTGEYDRGVFELNGGDATIRSYTREMWDEDSKIQIQIEDVPDEHIEYFSNMPYYIETDDFILSHAGVSKFIEDSFRDTRDFTHFRLMWDRDRKSINLGKFQVFGHTPVKYIKVAHSNDKPVHINIDSKCYDNMLLTAVILPDMKMVQVRCIDERPPMVPSIYY